MSQDHTYNHADDIEFASAAEIAAFQDARLRDAVAYLAAHSPFYQRMFAEHSINPADIRTVADLTKLPFTDKSDLQLHNDDFLCVDRSRIVDYITTSGTSGDPVTFACSDADLDRLALNEMKSFRGAGLRPGNIVQLMTTLDKRFMAGMAYFLGLRRLGASVIRVGNGIPQLQWDTIQRIHPDTIMCVPSFILRLLDYADANGIDYHRSSVRRIIGIGEGLRNPDFTLNLLGQRITQRWPEVSLFATYSSTEMGATFSECQHGCGGHLHPELVITEIIGDDNRPVAEGCTGEVVVTTLGVEAMPLLRFRTGDLAARHTEPCRCGRNSYRLSPIVGRKNNMIKFKGTTLYPPALFDVLDNTPYVGLYQVVVSQTQSGTDHISVKISLKDTPLNSSDAIKDLKDRFRSRIRVAPDITIHDADSLQKAILPPELRKPVKFLDLR